MAIKKRHVNWLGWTVGCWLIIYSAYLESGVSLAIFLAGSWTVLTAFSYHSIAVVTGFEDWLEETDSEIDEAVPDGPD